VTARQKISFKNAIARLKAEFFHIEPEVGKLGPADQAHLARWADDDRAEMVWQKIQSLAWGPSGSYDPLDGFIVTVLGARFMAETIHPTGRITEKYKERSARYFERAQRLEELAKDWKDIAQNNHPKAALALKRSKQYEEEAQAWRKLAKKPPPKLTSRPFHISRVDRAGSRNQRAFMQYVGEYIIHLCGRALDSEVAMLNDIAFDTQESTSAFQARSARRATTRKGRSIQKIQKFRRNSRAKKLVETIK
jgi:hypothetical protein